IATTLLRLVRARSMPASRLAKAKTALLMLGLLVALASVAFGADWLFATATLIILIAAALALISLAHYVTMLGQGADWLELAGAVTDIDFADWHQRQGVTAVLFDIDGTLTPWLGSRVPAEVVATLQRAKKVGITQFGLVSNASRRS